LKSSQLFNGMDGGIAEFCASTSPRSIASRGQQTPP
jgi:hypothetical protein